MKSRRSHWENVYSRKTPLEVSWYQQDPALSLQLIRNAQISSATPIIDVGGGASVLVDHLLDAGYSNISVLDISSRALAHARKRLVKKACKAEWYDTDVLNFEPPRSYGLWHDRAVFHFLTEPADREKYLGVLKRSLRPGGYLVIMTFAMDGPVKCSGLDIVQYDTKKLMAELGVEFELSEAGTEVHSTPSGGEQKFAYFLCRKCG